MATTLRTNATKEDLLQVKDAEIARLQVQLGVLEIPTARSIDVASTPVANSPRNPMNVSDDHDTLILQTLPSRRGKAPPVESFTGEESSVHWDDWLPTPERAAFLPTEPTEYGDILEYREELTLSLSSTV